MSDFLKSVDRRTSLAGMNRMELLLFNLDGEQLYGINVFKVREVIQTPQVAPVPKADHRIIGVADIRGQTMPIIDLPKALGLTEVVEAERERSLTIVTEFNSAIQGFLVRDVDRIVHLRWEDIVPPPDTLAHVAYLTAVTRMEDRIIEILDVEKILSEVSGTKDAVTQETITMAREKLGDVAGQYFILAADDSAVARQQLRAIFDNLGVNYKIVDNGRKALEWLQRWARDAEDGMAPPVHERVLMLISDIEMPEMDGYTLTRRIREDDRLKELFVVLNSSLSGGFNENLTSKVGANAFLSKWHSDELATLIIQRLEEVRYQHERKESGKVHALNSARAAG